MSDDDFEVHLRFAEALLTGAIDDAELDLLGSQFAYLLRELRGDGEGDANEGSGAIRARVHEPAG